MISWKKRIDLTRSLGHLLFRLRSWLPLPWILLLFASSEFHLQHLLLGSALGLFGLTARLWAVSWIGSGSRRRDTSRSSLCHRGPYGLTRNPLYIANIILYVGLCISGSKTLLGCGVLIYSSLYYAFIIHFEESTWINDPAYRDYYTQVNRWLPQGSLSNAFELGPLWPALRSERSTILAWAGCMLFLLIMGLDLNLVSN